MSTTKILSFVMGIFALQACEFNQSVNKDLKTGAYLRGDGIGCGDAVMKVNNKREKRNTFVSGEKVEFLFNDVSGLKREGDKVFPGLSMHIIKQDADTVAAYQDLLADLTEGTDLSPLQLRAHFLTPQAYDNNEKYKVTLNIWDKKGDGTLHYELPFSVVENDLLNIKPVGISYKNLYLWDETEKLVVVHESVKMENTMVLIMDGLDGFEVVGDNVFPAFSLTLTDAKGRPILVNNEILESMKEEGVNAEAFKAGQLPITITFGEGEISNPCFLKASLTDLKSDKRLDITTELVLE